MSYCAHCLYEIAPRVKSCPECGRPVVKQLEPEQLTQVKWCLVAVFNDIIQADMVKTALTNGGIHSLLKTDVLTSALQVQGTATPVTYALLLVGRKQRRRARQIVKGMTGC